MEGGVANSISWPHTGDAAERKGPERQKKGRWSLDSQVTHLTYGCLLGMLGQNVEIKSDGKRSRAVGGPVPYTDQVITCRVLLKIREVVKGGGGRKKWSKL